MYYGDWDDLLGGLIDQSVLNEIWEVSAIPLPWSESLGDECDFIRTRRRKRPGK